MRICNLHIKINATVLILAIELTDAYSIVSI